MLKNLRMWLRFCGDIRIESLLAAARKLSFALVTKQKKIFKSLKKTFIVVIGAETHDSLPVYSPLMPPA